MHVPPVVDPSQPFNVRDNSPNKTLPKAIGIFTIILIVLGIIGIVGSLLTLLLLVVTQGTTILNDANTLSLTVIVSLIFSVVYVVFAIGIRRLQVRAYWATIGLIGIQSLQQFSPLNINLTQSLDQTSQLQLSSISQLGMLIGIITLLVFGLNYKSFMQAAQYAERSGNDES